HRGAWPARVGAPFPSFERASSRDTAMEEILEQITNKITMYATVLGAFADAQHLRLLKPGNERPEGNWHTREVNALKDVSRRLLNVYKESANNVEPRFAGEVQ